MDEIISFNDQFYILASSSMADNRTRVLKHGETFGVFDRYGDIQPVGRGTQGLYHEGTRFLSRQELFLDNDRPMLLSSTVKEDNALLAVDMTNPDLYRDGRIVRFDFSEFGEASAAKASVTRKVDAAAEREKASRSIFAQHAIKAHEIE